MPASGVPRNEKHSQLLVLLLMVLIQTVPATHSLTGLLPCWCCCVPPTNSAWQAHKGGCWVDVMFASSRIDCRPAPISASCRCCTRAQGSGSTLDRRMRGAASRQVQ